MNKFFEWMEEHFIPIAAKIGSQRHLVAIRDGFATLTPLIMAGAFATLFNNLGFEFYQNFMNWLLPANWKNFGGDIWNASFGLMSILVVFSISYHLARSYDKDGLSAGVVSVAASWMLYKTTEDGKLPLTFVGSQGLFVAIIVAIIATEIFVKLIGNPKLVIKMPDGVPPAVAKSFAALIPSIVVLCVTAGILEIFKVLGLPDIHQALFNVIQAPLQGVAGSLGGVLVIVFMIHLLWFFGLHGSNIMAPIINALLLPLTILNTEAFANGKPAEYILNSQFIDSYVNMGGSGTTIALLIAILIIAKRKSAQQKMMVGLGIAPGCFNINEPVIFGMPIILNPIYFVPFILAPMACTVIAYALTAIGFAPKVVVMAGWTTPPILGAILSTNSIRGGITALICLAAAVVIYLPFVAMAAKQENAAANKVENQVTV